MLAILNNRNFQAGFLILVFFALAALAAFLQEILILFIPVLLTGLYLSWQRMDIVFFLLLMVVPFSMEYSFSETISIDLPDEPLMILLAFGMIARWCYVPRILPGKIFRHPLISCLLLFFLWTIASVIFSSEPLLSIKYLLAKAWYILAFVFIPLIYLQDKEAIKKGIQILIISMAVVVLIILARHAWLGFRFYNVNQAVSPFFRNHVNYSAMLVCTIPILLAAYWLSKARIKIYLLLLMGIFLFALYFTYSRGAWLALGAGIGSFWLIRKKILVVTYIVSFLVVIISITWISANDNYLKLAPNYNKTIFHTDFGQHVRATYQLKDISTAERFYRWVAGVRMIKDNGLTGFGPNSFYYHYKEYTLPAFKTWVSENPERSTVHNYFLLLAIEQGLPGFILFMILLALLLYYAQHLYHRVRDVFYRTVSITAGILLTMIITLNFLSDLIETDKIGSLFFLCMALLVICDIKTRDELNPSPDIQRIP